MIDLEGVSLRRGATLVLDRLTLSLGAETTALVGPSGSGKSTLLRVIVGLEPPCAGSVRIDDRVVSHDGRVDVVPEDRNVAVVFQDLALWPHLSVHGNLAFGLDARRVPRAERDQRIARALASVGMRGMAARRPHELSGGERQRVAIARALVLEPAALLLDEPLGSLDVALKDELLALFARAFDVRPIPVVHVTHDPREAARLAGRIVVLEGGRIVQEGSLGELAAEPASPFVAAFTRAARGA